VTFAPATTGTSPTAADVTALAIGSANVQDWQVAITQQPPASAEVGDVVTAKATVTVDAGANDLQVNDLSAGAGTSGLDQVQFADATPIVVGAGSSKVLTVTARVVGAPGAGGIHLQVSVTGTLVTAGTKTADTNPIASTEALIASLAAVPATVLLGDQLTYTLTVTNSSDTPAQLGGLPAGLVAPAGTALVTRTDGSATVPPNGTSVWTLIAGVGAADADGVVITQAPAVLTYAMSAVGLAARPFVAAPTSVSSTVKAPVVAIGTHTLTDANGGTLAPGDTVNVSVAVGNTGGGATTATLADALTNLQNPTGITLDGAACGACTEGAASVTAPLGTLAAGGSHVVAFFATVPASPSGTTASDSATASFAPATTGTSPTAAGSASLTITIPGSGSTTTTTATTTTTTSTTSTTTTTTTNLADLRLQVIAPATALARHKLTYQFTITNNGPATATGVTLSTNLIAGGARLLTSPKGCFHGIHLVCTVGKLASGKSAHVTIVLAARGPAVYKNAAQVSGAESDPVPANNSLVATTTVTKPAV
jgi:uncharacterized repeat protein (TIGR01451 family)